MASVASAGSAAPPSSHAFSTTCAAKAYTYNQLAGYGLVPSDARDKFGDTISLGSSIAMASWSWKGFRYEGKLYGLPDRGWNTQGTVNFQPRIHEFLVTMTPAPNATAARPSAPNVALAYRDSILLAGPDGEPTTGLDADQTSGLRYPRLPLLPAATFTGDGFGGDGPRRKRVALDPEALVLAGDGGFWISDEYGPYIYKFDRSGRMTAAIAPPDALLPLRNGTTSFSSNNPPAYGPAGHRQSVPSSPTQGRQNNQGFEGMTTSPDGTSLWVLLQSAALQDGGTSASSRRYTRLLQYSVKKCNGISQTAVYEREYVVPLPTFKDASGKTAVAAQSEMHFVSDTQFLFLPRDSNHGRGLPSSESAYRHVDIFDLSNATDVEGPARDAFNASIASAAGVLGSGIAPATVCPFVDFNLNAQLARFNLHNGGPQDGGLLNEKWEGLALVPAGDQDEGRHGDEYFLFASSDNDFVTQNGFVNFGKTSFSDRSGFDLDSQMLVFRITLPKGSRPLVG
ncbi:outer membrane autotransporter [Metarhizium album ARSEF 1941]|uniref:Outer membrane autotransporter n=1 Tax=Metarhizium album (strain ARSEF 1941) TaxID=1081103 RepID=A0A0B2X047_METAS|nr:outer membrane autotransporter [Metarhizium album ARSEF 1941]KHN99057.1 outer membrane autotransporter [Metarhizium album ARSEF 1941]